MSKKPIPEEFITRAAERDIGADFAKWLREMPPKKSNHCSIDRRLVEQFWATQALLKEMLAVRASVPAMADVLSAYILVCSADDDSSDDSSSDDSDDPFHGQTRRCHTPKGSRLEQVVYGAKEMPKYLAGHDREIKEVPESIPDFYEAIKYYNAVPSGTFSQMRNGDRDWKAEKFKVARAITAAVASADDETDAATFFILTVFSVFIAEGRINELGHYLGVADEVKKANVIVSFSRPNEAMWLRRVYNEYPGG